MAEEKFKLEDFAQLAEFWIKLAQTAYCIWFGNDRKMEMTSTFLFYFMRQYFYAVTFFSCSDFTFTKELIQLFLLNCSCTS